METLNKTDFSTGSVSKRILMQAGPLVVAQLVHLLYNIVDRIYIGHLPGTDNLALTGIGLCFPLITITAAFTNLCASGATPLFSMARGEKDEKKAKIFMDNAFLLLIIFSIILTFVGYVWRRPILFVFGASEASYYYANQYLQIYIAGTVFAMISTGMNGFINAQGFPKIGMLTTVIGGVLNLVLDPLFIFVFRLGVSGAAMATVISQAVSAVWVIAFLTGPNTVIRLDIKSLKLSGSHVLKICTLGLTGFIMQITNALVQITCNNTLQAYGGDLYVGIMTVLNSVREILGLPVSGVTQGAQPVLGYNYGAKEYERVKKGIRFSAILGTAYTMLAWIVVLLVPKFFMGLFTDNIDTITYGIESIKIYFFGFVFMSFQFIGQMTFQALGKAKRAIFFSLLRKVVIVVPLTLILPALGYGVNGVFLAEPISNIVGGLAAFLTMYFTLYRRLGKEEC